MKIKKTVIALSVLSVLLSGCGSKQEAKETESVESTTVTTEAETTEAETTEAAEDDEELDEDDFEELDSLFSGMSSEIEATYDGSMEIDGKKIETLGDVLAIDGVSVQKASMNNNYILVAENDDIALRAVGILPDDSSEKLDGISMFDDNYEEELADIIGDIKIARLDDLSEDKPSQDELSSLVGLTGKELNEKGYEKTGHMSFNGNTSFSYTKGSHDIRVTFKEPITDDMDLNDDSIIDALTVATAEYSGISSSIMFNIY